jgi:hypothetical protein
VADENEFVHNVKIEAKNKCGKFALSAF